MDKINVRTTIKEEVSVPIAEALCSDFLEWLDTQGWVTEPRRAPASPSDGRSYQEMATAFVADKVHGR